MRERTETTRREEKGTKIEREIPEIVVEGVLFLCQLREKKIRQLIEGFWSSRAGKSQIYP